MRTQCVDTECHIFDVNPTVFALAADLKSLNGEHTLRSLATDVCKAQSVIRGGGGERSFDMALCVQDLG